jgi:Holliday junction resolvase RusA-like endonuclease
MSQHTILSTKIQGEITTNSNKEKIGKWRDSMDRTLASLHFQKIHGKKLRVSLKFWILKERLQNRKNDLDNLTKPVLDSLKRMGLIEDDSFIFHLEVSKFPTNGYEEVHIVIKRWM